MAMQGDLRKWYSNCEMRTVVLSDTSGPSSQRDVLHFQGYKIENEHPAVTAETAQPPQS